MNIEEEFISLLHLTQNPVSNFYLKKENINDPKDTFWRLSNTNFEHIKFVARDENHAKEISIDMIKRAVYQILGCVI